MRASRRKAREAALAALYKIEIAKSPIGVAIEEMREASDLDGELLEFAERLVTRVRENQAKLDQELSARILDYAYDRIGVVEKVVMRIAAYELLMEPAIPPAVTIDEAVEIARRYATPESGKFVNGVLDRLRRESAKANWDPATAPPEFAEAPAPDEPEEIEEVAVEAGSDEAKQLARIAGWRLRSE